MSTGFFFSIGLILALIVIMLEMRAMTKVTKRIEKGIEEIQSEMKTMKEMQLEMKTKKESD